MGNATARRGNIGQSQCADNLGGGATEKSTVAQFTPVLACRTTDGPTTVSRTRGEPSRASHPEFLPSLRLLVCRERYSLTDIGLMFGVSRERVRQWCVKYRIEHPDSGQGNSSRGLHAIRLWNDAKHCFEPVSRGGYNDAQATTKRQAKKALWRAGKLAQQEALIAVARQLHASTGQPIFTRVLAEVYFGRKFTRNACGPALCALWQCAGTTTKLRWRAMRQALTDAGVPVQKQGGNRTRHRWNVE